MLGPTLCNVPYNGVLALDMPKGVRLVACADNLAARAWASNKEQMCVEENRPLDMADRDRIFKGR